MAKENGAPSAAEKGKGKAVDGKPADGEKQPNGTKKGEDNKLTINGKKGEEPQEGMRGQQGRLVYSKRNLADL